MNGNVTKEGITADLTAMKEVGIGGAQMFTVDQGIPAGDAPYAGAKWRELTAFAVREAGRLGIELCIHNCAGWSSSGGPWIQPKDAMQVLAWSTLNVQGPAHVAQKLAPIVAPQVVAHVDYAKDIAVFAYPTPASAARLPQFLEKTGVVRGDGLTVASTPIGPPIEESAILDITDRMSPDGTLNWNAPAGKWTILRMGHVPTGKDNHPAPPEGDGLEVDKLSKEALDKHWNGLMAKVVADAGPLAGKVLNNALIDSYEVGSQNWTPKFREEFQRRRGYDPLVRMLPALSGVLIDSRERTERFLWDYRRTIADLFADNYYGHFRDLCHQNGLLFSTEPYGNGGFDTIQSGSKADILMGEFWLGGAAMETTKLASSIAHVYGQNIVGAESFTADEGRGKWLEQPADMKAIGDLAFCNGVNRYIFHRYAMQPWTNLKPGMTMGPWGTHLERTQTWWEEAREWMKYVARCQYMLQQGRFVADAVYYYGENAPVDLPAPANLRPQLPKGYDYDGCDRAALLSMSVKNGRVLLPSGMSYRLLILPDSKTMTPEVARKLRSLVQAGAIVVGSAPTGSPSLTNYPDCDTEVRNIARSLWGPSRNLGSGRVFTNVPLASVFKSLALAPDFDYSPRNYSNQLLDIHRRIGDADVYFVSNQRNRPSNATCTFRVGDRLPELWHPETGRMEPAVAFSQANGRTSVALQLGPTESVFVVFRHPAPKAHLVSLTSSSSVAEKLPKIKIISARYESADGRGADVTAKVREMTNGGELEIPASNAAFGDPVPLVVKRLVIEYSVDGKLKRQSVAENGSVLLLPIPALAPAPAFSARTNGPRSLEIVPWKPGQYRYVDAANRAWTVVAKQPPLALDLSRNWDVTFAPNLGAPARATFPTLTSWSQNADKGIRYFSGSATYRKQFSVPSGFASSNRSLRLDLGAVKDFATVTLNGKKLATLWKPPFIVDLSGKLKTGTNQLAIKITNRWPNRLIGDEQLPPDAEWDGNHLKRWPDWLVDGTPRPKTGRVTFTTWRYYDKNSPLLDSGLLGPVHVQSAAPVEVKY
jgi:hypothetical protein